MRGWLLLKWEAYTFSSVLSPPLPVGFPTGARTGAAGVGPVYPADVIVSATLPAGEAGFLKKAVASHWAGFPITPVLLTDVECSKKTFC